MTLTHLRRLAGSLALAALLAGCLSSPSSPTCAELPPGSAGCEATPDGSTADVAPGPDLAVDMSLAPDLAPGPDLALEPDMAPAPDMAPQRDMAPDGGPCGPEVCNGLDDDCDGAADEALPDDIACAVIEGLCQSEGVEVCRDGAPVCDAPPVVARAETCDGTDQDCDGNIDEDSNFTSVEVRVGDGLDGVRPAIASLGEYFAVASRQAAARQAQGQLVGGEGAAVDLFDRRGRALDHRVVEIAGAEVTALTVTAFANGGDAGFALIWADRIEADGAETYTLRLFVGFPSPNGFADVGLLELLSPLDRIEAIDAVADPGGIAVAWVAGDNARYGYIDFGVEPPTLQPRVIGGRAAEPIDDIAIGAADGQLYVAYTLGQPQARQRRLELVRTDGGFGRFTDPIELAAGDRLASPSVGARPGEVFVAWSEVIAGVEQVRMRPFDSEAAQPGETVQITDGPAAARGPRLAVGAARVGIAWSDERAGDGQSEVWFTRLLAARDGWIRRDDEVRISNAPGRSGPVAMALDADFGAAWYDERITEPGRGPGVYFRAGPFTCDPVAAPQ